MRQSYYPPKFGDGAFTCPYCSVYAAQKWSHSIYFQVVHAPAILMEDIQSSLCSYCGGYALWLKEKLIFPGTNIAPLPNPDIPPDIQTDYLEAASILQKSPREAAALLRLAIQKLLKHLGQSGKDLDKDIGNLVKQGLPVKIQQSLDIVRVIGNNAVHPGQLDLKDDIETSLTLFSLVNLIVQDRISEPNEIENLFKTKIPESAKEHIAERDGKN